MSVDGAIVVAVYLGVSVDSTVGVYVCVSVGTVVAVYLYVSVVGIDNGCVYCGACMLVFVVGIVGVVGGLGGGITIFRYGLVGCVVAVLVGVVG